MVVGHGLPEIELGGLLLQLCELVLVLANLLQGRLYAEKWSVISFQRDSVTLDNFSHRILYVQEVLPIFI